MAKGFEVIRQRDIGAIQRAWVRGLNKSMDTRQELVDSQSS